LLTTKPPGTLVMGTPKKAVIRMGDGSFALTVQLALEYRPFGANAFFWSVPPPTVRGRIRIAADGTPVADPNLGGAGYCRVARPDGSLLFPPAPFGAAFVPPSTPANAIPGCARMLLVGTGGPDTRLARPARPRRRGRARGGRGPAQEPPPCDRPPLLSSWPPAPAPPCSSRRYPPACLRV
jgi:hypothetical protein